MDGSEKLEFLRQKGADFCHYTLKRIRTLGSGITQFSGRCRPNSLNQMWNRLSGREDAYYDEEGQDVTTVSIKVNNDALEEGILPQCSALVPYAPRGNSAEYFNMPPSSNFYQYSGHELQKSQLDKLKAKDYEWLEERQKALLCRKREHQENLAILRLSHRAKLERIALTAMNNHPQHQAFRSEIDVPD